jgi:hypothetical protein
VLIIALLHSHWPHIPCDLWSGLTGRLLLTRWAGVCNIAFSRHSYNSVNARHTVKIWLRKNGVDIDWAAGDVFLGTSVDTQRTIAAWNYVAAAAPGEYCEFLASSTAASGVSVLADPLSIPRIPSTILTVNQVG